MKGRVFRLNDGIIQVWKERKKERKKERLNFIARKKRKKKKTEEIKLE